MKKIITFLLTIVVLATTIPMNATAANFNFTDVSAKAWYVNGINFANSKGIMTGYQGSRAGQFGPNDNVTRTQFATMIYRLAGEPDVEYESLFPDVPNGKYYSKAVTWCAKNGIITGFSAGERAGQFGSRDDDVIERQQVATILFRYAKDYMQIDTRARADYAAAGIIDSDTVSEYARIAMSWCVANHIITGKDQRNGTFLLDPKGKATRAEAATMINRFTDSVHLIIAYTTFDVNRDIPVGVGDYFTFGHYEQDGDSENDTEPIVWKVLCLDEDKALVVSKNILDAKPFNTTRESVTYRDSTLRQWLNKDFIKAAFSEAEASRIVLNYKDRYNVGDGISFSDTNYCAEDYVFLPIDGEITYFDTDPENRYVSGTVYARQNGLSYYYEYLDSDDCPASAYWLRAEGMMPNSAAFIMENGSCSPGGIYVDSTDIGVRPAMWIKLRTTW